MWSLIAAGLAWGGERIEACTDRGGLVAEIGEDGSVSGWLGGWRVAGTKDALELYARTGSWEQPDESVFWRGSLAALDPQPLPPEPTAEALAQRFASLNPEWRARGDRIEGPGFRGRVGADGVLRGERGGEPVAFARDLGGGFFGGPAPRDAPLAALPGALSPQPALAGLTLRSGGQAAALGRVVREHLRQVDQLIECPLSGKERFYVGSWPEPLPLPAGRRVAYATAEETLLRGPEGATWLLSLPLSEPLARGLAAELAQAWPDRRTAVAWSGGQALVQVGQDPQVRLPGVEPAAWKVSLAPHLAVDPAVQGEVPPPESAAGADLAIFGPGREALARLNALRREAGLAPLAWDETLAWSALGHCAYLDRAQRDGRPDPGHDQEPGTPLFLGRRAQDRAGAAEVIAALRERPPHAAVSGWIESPFHRAAPLHPRAAAAGACVSAEGMIVMEVSRDPGLAAPPIALYPPRGARGVPRVFEGREIPDPLPPDRYPDKTLPVGYTLTVWLEDLQGDPKIEQPRARIVGGADLPLYVVQRPEDHRGDSAIFHLIPRDPFPPGVEVEWGAKVKHGDETQEISGQFTVAADPGESWVELGPLTTRLLEAANAQRSAGSLPPLRTTERAQMIATLYAINGGWQGVRRVEYRGAQSTCAPPRHWERALAAGPPDLSPLVDPRYHLFGAGLDPAGELCILGIGDALAPMRP